MNGFQHPGEYRVSASIGSSFIRPFAALKVVPAQSGSQLYSIQITYRTNQPRDYGMPGYSPIKLLEGPEETLSSWDRKARRPAPLKLGEREEVNGSNVVRLRGLTCRTRQSSFHLHRPGVRMETR